MNKEAKAIVEYLEEEREAIRTKHYYPDDVLNCEDLITLMDYINQLETNRDEAIDLIVRNYYSKTTIDINSIGYTTNKFLKIKEILERGKE